LEIFVLFLQEVLTNKCVKPMKYLTVSCFKLKVFLVYNLPYRPHGLREIMAILLERQNAYSNLKA